MKNITLVSLLIFLALACEKNTTASEAAVDLPEVSMTTLESHLVTLADDSFEGRRPCTPGEQKTINYLAEQLKALGVQPGNGDSYFQEVPLLETAGTPSETMDIQTPKGPQILKVSEDFVWQTERQQPSTKVEDSPLVFCGYGINAPEVGWNDYAGLDMKGKTAIVLVNDPGFGGEDSTFFKGNTMTYYGRWTYKYEEADRQGADGLIIIHEATSAGYPWYVVQNSWSGTSLGLVPEDPNYGAAGKGWIPLDQAKVLFENCGLNLGEQIRAARTPGFKPVPLNATVTASTTNVQRTDVSQNVIGMIPGSKYPDEYIIYSAHWDHLGIGRAVEGDSIYNGAIDNASGTSALLAIAEAYQKAEVAPERSVVFLFVTAEEQGLLGSAYYAANPIFPVEQSVANINIDALNGGGAMKDLTITGYGHSDMDDLAAAVAKKYDRYVLPDQEPEKGYFFRSDHFHFAKKGIPALYAGGSYDHREKGKDFAKAQNDDYLANRYHQPADEYVAGKIDLSGAKEDAQLLFEVGYGLSTSRTWPQWKPSSEFRGEGNRGK